MPVFQTTESDALGGGGGCYRLRICRDPPLPASGAGSSGYPPGISPPPPRAAAAAQTTPSIAPSNDIISFWKPTSLRTLSGGKDTTGGGQGRSEVVSDWLRHT